MSFLIRWTLLLVCGLGVTGCWPAAQGPLDEQKESNFLTGKARGQDRDFDGAIEAFEKALEVNPHSASAHFELGRLYDQEKNDFAAALYHYERARRLRPNEYPGDLASQRIELCKRELAKSVTQTPTSEYMQKELDRLTLENQNLRQRVLEWQNYYHGRANVMPAAVNLAPAVPGGSQPSSPVAPHVESVLPAPTSPSVTRSPQPAPRTSVPSSSRTHKIASGETLSKIAARYGVKLSSLKAANPGLDDRRLRPGQTVVIP